MTAPPTLSLDEKLAAASRELSVSSIASVFAARVKEGAALAEAIAVAQPTRFSDEVAGKLAAALHRISSELPPAACGN